MKVIHFKLLPRAPVSTPWQGDTLLGHVLWMFAYHHSAAEISTLFERIPGDPPAITDLFPEGMLPIPNLPPDDGVDPSQRKKLRKIKYLPMEDWDNLRKNLNGVSLSKVLKGYLQSDDAKQLDDKEKNPVQTAELHSTINRITGTTGEGDGLYPRIVTHYPEGYALHGWIAPGALGEELIIKLLGDVGNNGYGADASTGLGQFEIEDPPLSEEWKIPNGANAWMSLSRHIFDPTVTLRNARYQIETHYGRLGGSFANMGNPFKKPLLLCQTGSLWRSDPKPDWRPGFMLDNVAHGAPANISHVGYTIPWWVNWEEQ